VDDFDSLDTPGGPGGVRIVEWNQNQLIRSLCEGITQKYPNDQIKKTEIFKTTNSRKKNAKNSRIGPWISSFDWCEGHWCGSTYMVMKLSDMSSKTGKKCIFCFLGCFWAYVGQPHDHIDWAAVMPFASINTTNSRTNPWHFCEIFFENWQFWKSQFFWVGHFEFKKKKKKFASFSWKQVKVSWLARLGWNFEDYLGLQLFFTLGKHYAPKCMVVQFPDFLTCLQKGVLTWSCEFKNLLQLGLNLQNQDRLYAKNLPLRANLSNLSYYIKTKIGEGRSDKKGRHKIGSFFQMGPNGT
jgi:hypothetical protein